MDDRPDRADRLLDQPRRPEPDERRPAALDGHLQRAGQRASAPPTSASSTSGLGGSAPTIASAVAVGGAPSATWTVTVSTAGTTGSNSGSGPAQPHRSRARSPTRPANPLGGTPPIAGQAYTFDTTPPATPTITAGPPQLPNWTTTTNASFSFTGDAGVTFLCSLNSTNQADFTACTSAKSYSGVAQGLNTFRVEARDAAGNLSPIASRQWQVDTINPPTPVFTLTPPDPNSTATSNFDWTPHLPAADIDHYECSKENGSFAPCGPPPYSYAVATTNNGQHQFAVRAVDAAGNVGRSISYSWKVAAGSIQDFTIDGNAVGLIYPGGVGAADRGHAAQPEQPPDLRHGADRVRDDRHPARLQPHRPRRPAGQPLDRDLVAERDRRPGQRLGHAARPGRRRAHDPAPGQRPRPDPGLRRADVQPQLQRERALVTRMIRIVSSGKRRLALAGVLVVAAVAALTAVALLQLGTGAGTGSANVGSLNPPTDVTVPATSTGTVHVTWTASGTSGGGVTPNGYYVERNDGSSWSPACGSSPASLVSGTGCDDTVTVAATTPTASMAVYHSWTATSALERLGSRRHRHDAARAGGVRRPNPVNGSTVTFPFATNQDVTSIGGTCGTARATSRPRLEPDDRPAPLGHGDLHERRTGRRVRSRRSPRRAPTRPLASQSDSASNTGHRQQAWSRSTRPTRSSRSRALTSAAVSFLYALNTNVTTVGGACGDLTGDSATIRTSATQPGNARHCQSGTATCSGGAWTYPASPALSAGGSYTVTATQADAAGNSGNSGGEVDHDRPHARPPRP